MNDWQTVEIKTRTNKDGTTYQLVHDGQQISVRFHNDGTLRLAGEKGSRWMFANGPAEGKPVYREHESPVVRVRPQR